MGGKTVYTVIPGDSSLFPSLNKRLCGVRICKCLSCLGVGFCHYFGMGGGMVKPVF